MENWKRVKISELCDLLNGYAFKSKDYIEQSNTLNIRMSNIRPDGQFNPDYQSRYLPEEYKAKYSRFLLEEGDLIIAMTDMANNPKILGIPTIVRNKQDRNFLLNQRVGKLKDIDQEKVISDFLRYCLMQENIKSYYKSKAKKGIQVNIGKSDILSVEINLPPLKEQKIIAGVLSLVQNAIAQQEKAIALTTELKKALMQKLFTEGTRKEAQKQTEIGLIPESWDVVQLGKIAKIGNGATPKKSNISYWENGSIPWLTSTKIHDSIILEPEQYVTAKAVKECHLPLVKADSLLVAITGQGKTLGNSALVKFDTRINQHLAYAQFKTTDIVPVFVLAFMQGRYEHLRQIAKAGGSTKGALTCGFLKTYSIPVPKDKQEQELIARLFNIVNQKNADSNTKIKFLQDLFQTLLHQLMTAKIRVSELNLDSLNLDIEE